MTDKRRHNNEPLQKILDQLADRQQYACVLRLTWCGLCGVWNWRPARSGAPMAASKRSRSAGYGYGRLIHGYVRSSLSYYTFTAGRASNEQARLNQQPGVLLSSAISG
jgi:hypothetical protein